MRGLPPLAWIVLAVTLGWIAVEIAVRQLVGAIGSAALRVAWSLLSVAVAAGVAVADYLLLSQAGEQIWAVVVAAIIAAVYAAWLVGALVALVRRHRHPE